MLNCKKFIEMISHGADAVIAAEEELTAIDAKFGDADHGITMTKVMNSVKSSIATEGGSIKDMLDAASMGVMMINGGSAVPLWSTLFDGFAQGAPDAEEVDEAGLKQIFATGKTVFHALSKANVGDKTMMDTLSPAVDAIVSAEGDIKAIMTAGAEGAKAGAEASKGFVSKFGRAKSYKEQTIGTPDAGAVSMMYFFVGMSEVL